MRLYHTTTPDAAQAIVAGDFRDAEGHYLTENVYRGVWLADRPLDWNEASFSARELDVLTLEVPEQVVRPFEWIEEMKPYREFLAPAEIVNRYPIVDVRSIREHLSGE